MKSNETLREDIGQRHVMSFGETMEQNISQLLQIKNRLAVLIPLVKDGKLQPNEELQQWLDLRDHLP